MNLTQSITANPLGLITEQGYEKRKNLDRIKDISNAIKRYSDAEKKIPLEWIDELKRRVLEENK